MTFNIKTFNIKVGLMAAIALLGLTAGSFAVTASPQRRPTQSPNPAADSGNLNRIGDLQRRNTVTIAGEVVQIRGDEFILRDTTGELLVEAESPAIRQAGLQAGDRVTIAGRYDEDSFEAFSITPANGTAIYVFDD